MKKIVSIIAILLLVSNITFAVNFVQMNDNLYFDKDSVEYYVDSYGKKDFDKYSFWVQSINNKSEYWKKLEDLLKKVAKEENPNIQITET